MTLLVFLDQNAWIALARGSWDKANFAREHAALAKIVENVRTGRIIAPLTFANIYETLKINDPVRRANIARVQALISGGQVFRGRRRILTETLSAFIANKLSIPRPTPAKYWFLSDLWFESAVDYTPDVYGFEISPRMLHHIRRDPRRALFDYLVGNDEEIRLAAVRRFSGISAELAARIEARRTISAGETLAMRKRAYSARLMIDELDLILAIGQELGLDWHTVRDVGPSLTRRIAADVPIFKVERELAVRLEDQSRAVNENDLRDMASFLIALPLADLLIAERQFVNLAIQARLDKIFGTQLMTSIFEY